MAVWKLSYCGRLIRPFILHLQARLAACIIYNRFNAYLVCGKCRDQFKPRKNNQPGTIFFKQIQALSVKAVVLHRLFPPSRVTCLFLAVACSCFLLCVFGICCPQPGTCSPPSAPATSAPFVPLAFSIGLISHSAPGAHFLCCCTFSSLLHAINIWCKMH